MQRIATYYNLIWVTIRNISAILKNIYRSLRNDLNGIKISYIVSNRLDIFPLLTYFSFLHNHLRNIWVSTQTKILCFLYKKVCEKLIHFCSLPVRPVFVFVISLIKRSWENLCCLVFYSIKKNYSRRGAILSNSNFKIEICYFNSASGA